MVWATVTELLLTTVLSCRQANMIISRALLNRNISTAAVAEIVDELREVTIPECVLPVID